MVRQGKRKVTNKYSSGDDSDGGAPRKKAPRNASSSDGVVVCQISNTRRVSVRTWQGKAMVDIREFYEKDGKELPGKKGISLDMDQWKILKEHVNEIDQAVENQAEGNKAVDDKAKGNKVVDDKANGNKAVDDKAEGNQAVKDEAVSDQEVGENA